MDHKRYWEKFKEKFNGALDRSDDSEFRGCFTQISRKIRDDTWQDLNKIENAPFIFSFSIGDCCPKLDIVFKKDRDYNLEESRNSFLKNYMKDNPECGLTVNDRDVTTENPQRRCSFKMSDTVVDEGEYDRGIDWQIKTLESEYKKVLKLNKEMIMKWKWGYVPTESNLIPALLNGFEMWLKEVRGFKGGAGDYKSGINTKGEKCAKYIGKKDVTELSCDDCNRIIENRKDIFKDDPSIDLDNVGSHFKMFANYLDWLNSISDKGVGGMTQTDEIYAILDESKQVILTGAPGTGKTYTVKKYVKRRTEDTPGKHWMFVQFHPSYDYSDFVEGLKPVPDPSGKGNMFVRIDGCFKAFCRQIVMAEIESIKKDNPTLTDEDAFGKYKQSPEEFEVKCDTIDKPQQRADVSTENTAQGTENKDRPSAEQYYFVIDEINRADLSKVFGEIMYCLDEDYRGPDNAIQTQYSALQTYHNISGEYKPYSFDCFENGFFIPENLHIIGTMNDIDRSVESFDFALRRRFMWKEIDANESIDELGDVVEKPDIDVSELIKKAKNINNLFVENEYRKLGLTKQFQLGKAYYKKYDGTEESLERIYRSKIEPIIKEYTRGRDSGTVNELLKKYGRSFLVLNLFLKRLPEELKEPTTVRR